MDTYAIAALISSLALAVAAVACGETGPEAAPRPDERPTKRVTSVDLASMVLPKEQLGPDFADFRKAPASGPVPNAGAAELMPGDETSADLAERGRRDGYWETYWPPTDTQPRVGTVVTVSTYVELLESAEAASAYVDFTVHDLERAQGRRRVDKRFLAVRAFEVTAVGDKGEGVALVLEVFDKKVFEVRIIFHVGQVVGTAVLGSVGSFVDGKQAICLAEALEARIANVVAGKPSRPRSEGDCSGAVAFGSGPPASVSLDALVRRARSAAERRTRGRSSGTPSIHAAQTTRRDWRRHLINARNERGPRFASGASSPASGSTPTS